MSTNSNISAPSQAPPVKKPWIAPKIEILNMDKARLGNTFGHRDFARRS
jgi:hypothetical protein